MPAYRRRLRFLVLAGLMAVLAMAAGQLPASAQQPAAQAQPEPKQPDGQPAATMPPQGQEAAKAALPSDVADNVSRLAAAIETAEKTIQQLADLEEELGGLRVDVETILSDSAHTAETLRPELAAVRSQIEKLGPPPGKDAPAEAPALAAERARLNALAAALDGGIKSAELTWVRARQLIEKITVLRSSLFTKNLMERRPSPLLPGMWRDLFNKSPGIGGRISYLVDDWLHWASIKQTAVWLLIAAALILFLALKIAARRLTERRHARREPPLPTFFERAMSVAWVAPVRALPAIAAAVLLYSGLEYLELLFAPWGVTAAATLKAIVLYAAVSALIFAVLAPRSPQWRLVSLADAPTRPVGALLCAITAVYAIDMALTDVSRVFYMPLAMTVVQTFAASVAFSVLLIGLLLTPFTPLAVEPAAVVEGGSPEPPRQRAAYPRLTPVWLKLPLWVITLGILALTGLGYVALARFIAQQLVMTGLVIVVTWLLYLAIRAITRDPQHRHNSVGELLEARFGLDAPRRNQLAWLTEVALTFALIIGALPFLMLQWGFSGAEIRDWFKSLFFGVEIGQFRISLARILIGIVLFIALLFATRLLQRWLRERALQQTRMDPGIVNSIDTVVGYIGIGLAALLAVSYAGLDITNLAIVAGALSVGIGFGLQSIVNNFVSGLILLVERPIRVGDRIVVGDQQGLVRRISVRATEIETFDRASLIVPNSELITGRVLNWTHRDSLGAVNVKVGVGYNSDPEQVIAVLKKCA
ncbi:MAG TPA: DUF3772 domain-containing protein, partial [Hyphomicrobiaceae bacterium]|nr:DUF3772 domain-containing protein [Hyphomicrobiaceae bacterium]